MTFDLRDRQPHLQCCFPASSFVGRRAELREVKGLLATGRLITLTGPGGVGKSRIAHQAEVTLRRTFEDGTRCIDMVEARHAGLLAHELQDPDLLAHLIATTLGVPGSEHDTATGRLAAALGGRPMLLLLDNCEHLLPACAMLADALLRACPALHIMATSREPLRLTGEVIYPVPPLPTPDPDGPVTAAHLSLNDSVALFVARAQAVSRFELTDRHAPAVAELCRRLDGLPLAVELAAARARALTPGQILDRMDERFGLLSRGIRTAPPRQRTLRACADWSYELCSKPERLLWARLSVFAGPFELDAVEDICTDDCLPADDLLDQVAGLVDKSVLSTETCGTHLRYRLLETFRDYGRGKLVEAGTYDEMAGRQRDWYRRLVRQASDDPLGAHRVDWLARLDRELPNLGAALAYSLTDPDGADAALEIAGGQWHRLAAGGRPDEARCWLDRALALPAGPTRGRLSALYGASVLAAGQGDLAGAAAHVRAAHEVATELGDADADAVAAGADAVLATALGELSDAARHWRRAAEGATGAWLVEAVTGLAATVALLGDVEAAAACHERLRALCPPGGEFRYTGNSLVSLGLANLRNGDLATAATRLGDGLRHLRTVTDRPGVVRGMAVLAWVAAGEHRAERAATLLGAVAGALPGGPLSDHHEQCARRVREDLGEAAYRAAFERGAGLSGEDAVGYALDESPPPSPLPAAEAAAAPLTRRERQVAELVALGRSNKEIAVTLVISRRTAESHVENILTKLGLGNRAQIAAWMAIQ